MAWLIIESEELARKLLNLAYENHCSVEEIIERLITHYEAAHKPVQDHGETLSEASED